MTERQLEVVRIDRGGNRTVMVEEAKELSKFDALLLGADAASEDEIIEAAKDADVILTSAAQMTRRVLQALPKCKAVIRYGIGFDTIDVDAATDLGILVINIPDYCIDEVSNHAITLLLACANKLVLLNNMTKEGRWSETYRQMIQPPMGLIAGQTLGIVGCGNIGRMTGQKAQCFGLKIIGYDPYVDNALIKACGIKLVTLPELLKTSDYVSIHTPLNQQTRHLIGKDELKQMKTSAYLVNTARGAVVDETALIQALQEKLIAGAGLDAFEKEPVDPNNPLLKMENVIVTPHSAYYSDASGKRLRTYVGQEAARVISGRWPKNVVNKSVKPKIPLTK